MNMIKVLHLLIFGAHRGTGFLLQPPQSATQRSYGHPSIKKSPTTRTRIHSSFSDLSARDEQDDKIQILLDSLDSIRTPPKEPDPIEEPDPMDDMVEKMAMPLKFLKGKEEKKGGDDRPNADSTNVGDEKGSKVKADSITGSSDDGVAVKGDQLADDVSRIPVESSTSPANAGLSKEDIKISPPPSESSTVVDESSRKLVGKEELITEKKPPAATVSSDDKKTESTQTTQTIKTKESTPQDTKTDEKSVDASKFGNIFDRFQAIDQASKSEGSTQTAPAEDVASTPTDSNLNALIQTIQLPTPTLPSFNPPNFGNVEFGLVGGAVVIISLYLTLAAYLRGVDKDEGYAEWDQYKRKDPTDTPAKKKNADIDTAMEAAADAINGATSQSTPYGLINKDQNPFISKPVVYSDNLKPAAKVAGVQTAAREKLPIKKTSPDSMEIKSSAETLSQLDRLDKIEQKASRVEDIIASKVTPSSSGSIEVQKIEEYCEPNKVNQECSESISSYLGSVTKQQVDEGAQKAAAQKIISYLDSLSSPAAQQGPSFTGTVPTKAKVVAKKEPSQTSAAFSSYLDALSSGSVQEAPSAKAVAGYLDVLSAEAKASAVPKVAPQIVDNRIEEVEDRLNRLESSVASLPDNIASRLIEWQVRQDQKVNDEIEKIKMYLMEEKTLGEQDGDR